MMFSHCVDGDGSIIISYINNNECKGVYHLQQRFDENKNSVNAEK